MRNKLVLTVLIALYSSSIGIAQQVNVLGNFMYNQLYYNPASAGMHETQVNVNVLGRLRWSSVEGSPRLGVLSADYRSSAQKMAVGLNLGTFSYSKYSFTDINANYAYFLYLNKKVKLSMGLRAGISSINSNTNGLTIWDAGDPLEASNNYSGILPKIGVGFQLNAPKYYVGFSLPDLYVGDNQNLLGDTASFMKQQRNYVVMGGAKLRLNDMYNFKPSVAFFYHPATGAFLLTNGTFEIRDYFWVGAGYATYKAFSINAGAHLSTRLRFAYAYEILSGARGLNLGSHEVCLLIKLDNLGRKSAK